MATSGATPRRATTQSGAGGLVVASGPASAAILRSGDRFRSRRARRHVSGSPGLRALREAQPERHFRRMFNFNASLSRGQAALRGAVALILGVVFIVWPNITIGTAVVLFAIYCAIDAGVQLSNV